MLRFVGCKSVDNSRLGKEDSLKRRFALIVVVVVAMLIVTAVDARASVIVDASLSCTRSASRAQIDGSDSELRVRVLAKLMSSSCVWRCSI